MNDQSYIYSEFEKFTKRYPSVKQVAIMRDGFGIYAISMTTTGGRFGYFCAKNSTKGNTISVHKKLFQVAHQYRHPIIMSIGGTFYKFDPDDIAKHNHENEYHNATMVNFNMNVGKRMDQKPQISQPELFSNPIVQTIISTFGAIVVKGGG